MKNALSGIVYQRLIGGKGVLTYADKNFANHKDEAWYKKIASLVKSGLFCGDLASSEKNISQATSQTDYFDA